MPQMAAPRACPNFNALSGLRLTKTRSMAISCGRYSATMAANAAKYLAQTIGKFALVGANHAARHVGQSRAHGIQDAESRALGAGIDAQHAHASTFLGSAIGAYDTGNRRLNPPARSAQIKWKQRSQPGPRRASGCRRPLPALRGLDLPDGSSGLVRAGLDSRGDRAQSRCRRRRGDRRHGAAAARCQAPGLRRRRQAIRRGATRLARNLDVNWGSSA